MVSESIADLQLIPQAGEPVATAGDVAADRPSELGERKPAKRLLKFSIASAAVLLLMCVLGTLALTKLRMPEPRKTDDDTSLNLTAAPAPAPTPSAAASGDTDAAKPALNTSPYEVTVQPDQTLEDISEQYLGGYDLRRLHQIQVLNPTLTDPDYIEAGEKIWLPGAPPVAMATNATPRASVRKLP